MKRWLVAAILLVLTLPSIMAQTEILDADMATIEMTIGNNIELVAVGPNVRVSEATANLQWYPRKSFRQFVESLETEPLAEETDTAYQYTWEDPGIGDLALRLQSVISTSNDIYPITQRVPFPPQGVTPDLLPYTRASEMIDITPEMEEIASELAANKDDLYEVVFALADWVTTNIEYNLSTLTAEATYPSSWVLEKRYGVCDELTSLFISLNRALGIPSRFVSGLAYTDLPALPEEWGGHGWAEIYFPGHGWIPFDATYGEYGYIDAGHIKLKNSVDAESTSITVSGTGNNFDIRTEPLDFDINILGERERSFDIISVEAAPYAKEVGFGSYNLITVTLQNLRNYYVSTRVELGETTRMSHGSPDSINVLLKPRGKQNLYFLVKVDDDLDDGYLYTFPIGAYTKLASPEKTEFSSIQDGPMLDRSLFTQYFSEQKKRAAKIEIACDYPQYTKVGTTTISCDFTNREGRKLEHLDACIYDECVSFNLDPSQTRTVEAAIEKHEPGIYAVPIVVSNSELQKTHFETLNVLDETTMAITNVEIPQTITYDDEGELRFVVERTSLSAPKSVRVHVEHPKFTHDWETLEVETSQEYILRFRGQNLEAGENTMHLTVEYEDVFGDNHRITEEVPIILVGLTTGQKVTLWLDKLERWLERVIG